jgi:hypothetical protein
MSDYFGDFMGPLVARSDRLAYDRDRLRKRARDLRGEDRQRRYARLAQTRAGIYFGASSVAGADLMLASLRGELHGVVPICAAIASLPAPVGGTASQIATRWVLNPTPGFSRHSADVAYGRHVEIVPPAELYGDSFYFSKR